MQNTAAAQMGEALPLCTQLQSCAAHDAALHRGGTDTPRAPVCQLHLQVGSLGRLRELVHSTALQMLAGGAPQTSRQRPAASYPSRRRPATRCLPPLQP